MTPWLDRSRGLVMVALGCLAAALLIALVGLVLWRAIDEMRFLLRQRRVARYRPLVDALLTSTPAPETLQRLIDTPARHRDVLADLLLASLRLTTGDVVPRLREAAAALGLVDRWTASLEDRRWWVRAAAVHRPRWITDAVASSESPSPGLTNAAAIDASVQPGPTATVAVLAARPMRMPPCAWPTRLPT